MNRYNRGRSRAEFATAFRTETDEGLQPQRTAAETKAISCF
ncbi:MAG: hypothetical protein V7724_07170 [Sediminicola sp.]